MDQPSVDIAVIVSTYNRGALLRETLDSLVAQQARALTFELLVVDNNSSDDTSGVIGQYAAAHPHVRHLFEPRQGVSHGRNAALAVTRASIVAFTDDDVLVPPTWLASIRGAFDEHPEVDYVSGRILPIWLATPPQWMATATNGVCALRDDGDVPRVSRAGAFFPGWATANIAFRREALQRVGGFNGDFPRGGDLELILRMWRAGSRGLYAPDVVVRHAVHPERMTKTYHRWWHTTQGALRSRLHFREIFDGDDRILNAPLPASLFGVAGYVYRQLGSELATWLGAIARRDEARTFACECRVRQSVSYIRTRMRHARAPQSATADLDAQLGTHIGADV